MDDRALLRHTLAVLAYRGGKPLRDAPATFTAYDTGEGRTPLHILAHISDLLIWAHSIAQGTRNWPDGSVGTWEAEIARFYASLAALAALDTFVGSEAPIHGEIPRLMAGPIADALTHVGQLTILRRMAGAATIGENYYDAEIVTGRVGPDQAPPIKLFR
jgi:hypothetical protein